MRGVLVVESPPGPVHAAQPHSVASIPPLRTQNKKETKTRVGKTREAGGKTPYKTPDKHTHTHTPLPTHTHTHTPNTTSCNARHRPCPRPTSPCTAPCPPAPAAAPTPSPLPGCNTGRCTRTCRANNCATVGCCARLRCRSCSCNTSVGSTTSATPCTRRRFHTPSRSAATAAAARGPVAVSRPRRKRRANAGADGGVSEYH